MVAAFALVLALCFPAFPHQVTGVAAATPPKAKREIVTEKALLKGIDRELGFIKARLAKQAAPPPKAAGIGTPIAKPEDSLGGHFEKIAIAAVQIEATPEFLKKSPKDRQEQSAAIQALTKAAKQAASVCANGTLKNIEDARSAVAQCRAALK